MRWVAPDFNPNAYNTVVFNGLELYPAPKPNERVNMQTLQQLQAYMTSSAKGVLEQKCRVVPTMKDVRAGSRALVMRAAITGVSASNEGMKWYEVVVAAQLGPMLGLVLGVAGMVGTIAVGWVSDRLSRRTPSRRVLTGAVIQMLVWPCMVGVLLAGDYSTALWLMLVPGFFSYAPVALSWVVMQNLSPPRMRATLIGIGVLVANIGALVIGPQLVGLANGDATVGLRNALLLSGLLYPWAAWHYLRATALLKH
jgi:MFS family permease